MKRLFTNGTLLFVGVFIGWWLHGQSDAWRSATPDDARSANDIPVATITPSLPRAADSPAATLPVESESVFAPDAASFADLLAQGEYALAVAYYEQSLQRDASSEALLKPGLQQYLKARVQACSGSDFIDLVELWLESYYSDIDALLLLAEHQRLCSSPEEAARTLQIARTYAMLPGQPERVSDALSRLIATTEQQFSTNQDWIELLGFYEFLAAIDLDTRWSQLHRAALYQRAGEGQRSRALLLGLQEEDDGLDAQWSAALSRQASNADSQAGEAGEPDYEIALTRRGNQFLVPVLVNGTDSLDLMIDTGASITTLSRASFDQIDGADARYMGTQLFNTANGITQGELYRIAALRLGDTEIRDLDIAVLDMENSRGFDGLLGMNVLRNYRFNIDQDREVLNMTPRL